MVTERTGGCYHCETDCGESEFCYGCGEFICQTCSVNSSLSGQHHPEDHLVDEEGD